MTIKDLMLITFILIGLGCIILMGCGAKQTYIRHDYVTNDDRMGALEAHVESLEQRIKHLEDFNDRLAEWIILD